VKIKYKHTIFLLSSFVCAATLSSNTYLFGMQSNHFFGVISGLFASFFFRLKDILYLTLLALLLILSSLKGVFSTNYWIVLIYKLITFMPIFVLVRLGNLKIFYDSLKFVLIITSLIAVILLILGYSNPRFILYGVSISDFRWAALVIEPGGYAISVIILSALHNSINLPKYGWFFYFSYLLITITRSSAILFKIIYDYLNIQKLKYKIYLILFLTALITYLFIYTRLGISVTSRINQYYEIISFINFSFFGDGIYQNKYSMALPGFFRFIIETGVLFSFFLLFTIIYLFIRQAKYLYAFLPILLIPFVQEAYLSSLYWYFVMMFLLRKKDDY
jgi:hypothetical protein